MEVILLERIAKLGQMGDVVRVKDGFARNYLLPQRKALRANADAEALRAGHQRLRSATRGPQEAEAVGRKLTGQSLWSGARPVKPASSTARFDPTSPDSLVGGF